MGSRGNLEVWVFWQGFEESKGRISVHVGGSVGEEREGGKRLGTSGVRMVMFWVEVQGG